MSNRLSNITSIVQERFFADIPDEIRQNLSPRNPLWLAVSGGRDSMALLHVCHQLNLPIHAIHVNHQLQASSNDWQSLVADFCQNHAITFSAVAVAWETFFLSQNQPSPNLTNVNEQHARQARYQAIMSVIEKFSSSQHFPILALAHHANDQTETVLLNLLRGAGMTGLAGMKPWSLQQEFGRSIWLWRPLLSVSRKQISEYVTEQGIPFVDDPTNVAGDNQRAFLRQKILPILNERFSDVVQTITRTSQNMAEIAEIIDGQVQTDLGQCLLSNHDQNQHWGNSQLQQCLAIPSLQQLAQANRLQLLHHWLKGEEKFAPPRDVVLQVNALILHHHPDQQTLLQWQGFVIRRYREVLYRLSPTYIEILKSQTIEVCLRHEEKRFKDLPISVRPVKEGESFVRFSRKPFHESYKKICQRFNIPSWERGLGRVLIWENMPIALLLPQHSLWLIGVESLINKDVIKNDNFLSRECVWYIKPEIR